MVIEVPKSSPDRLQRGMTATEGLIQHVGDAQLVSQCEWMTLGREYDARLGSYGSADYAAQIARDHRYLDRLAALDPAALSPRIALDRRMLENSLRDDLLLNESMRMWRRQPDGYVQTASNAVFLLVSRKFAPPVVRLNDAIAREEQIPRLFEQARANLSAARFLKSKRERGFKVRRNTESRFSR